ncbi:MAG: hypothetical protein KGZ65_04560 [Sphingomonadales bacterium]|nr:hypothetical protein [Sphingomonadaceae bacterium]MBS3930485.1 hypothetical protein [Sphingomonadales bacterium]
MNPMIRSAAATLAVMASLHAVPALADSPPKPVPAPVTYADLADLVDATPLVIRAQPRKIIKVEPERARGLRTGWGRFYIEAKTEALIAGTVPLGGALTYLVDLPLDQKGKPPAIKKKSVVLFARPVPGRPGELQLVAPDAQLLWDPALELRIKGLLGELYTPGAPHRITGVREAIHVGGELAGEGETQIFLTAANGEPAAIAVNRKPGQVPRWGVSFSELLASDAAPRRDSLGWYRLACFLPRELPGTANVSERSADRAAAAADYAFVIGQLGPCLRTRK